MILHVNVSIFSKVYYCDECYSLIYTIGEICTVPITHRILSRIKAYIAVHWKDVGYELIDANEVEIIALNAEDMKEKCFTMLKKWLETDRNPCYCKLFAALEVYEYFDQIRKVKEIIHSS